MLLPGLELRQTSFVGLEDLLLVKEATRSRYLARHDSNAAEASPAVRRMVVRERHDFKAFPEETAETRHGEHGGLVGRGCSSNVHTYEQCSVVMQDPPHLLQGEPRIRHMIESVTTYDQIGTPVQQGKIFGPLGQMYGSAADFIFNQHSELLIDIQKWVNGDFDARRKRREVSGATAAETHDGLALGPPHVAAQVTDDLFQQEPRIREPFGILGAAEVIAPILFMAEEPANFIQITRVGQIRDLWHRSTSAGTRRGVRLHEPKDFHKNDLSLEEEPRFRPQVVSRHGVPERYSTMRGPSAAAP